MTSRPLTRRCFLQGAALLGASIAVPTVITTPIRGQDAPSNRINIACIGLGGMGMHHLNGLVNMPECRVAALCDVDLLKMEPASAVSGLTEAECTQDFRTLLDRPDIDAVNIATPDHWHVPMAMAAARAGKAVYVQKPISLNVREGRQLVRLANDLGTIVQTGSQQRSSRNFRHAAELVLNGYLGDIKRIEVGLEKPYNPNPGLAPPEPVPDRLDYDMWLGPAACKPFSWERVAHFRGSFDYSGGYFSDWAAHHHDIVQWALGMDDSGPPLIEGVGTFHDRGTFNVPMTYHVTYTYPCGATVVASEQYKNGIRFEGSDGWLFVSRKRMITSRNSLMSLQMAATDKRLIASDDHLGNFFQAMRGAAPLIADHEVGHRSATVCHLGNISMRLGRPIRWDPVAERIIDDEEANRLLAGVSRNQWRIA